MGNLRLLVGGTIVFTVVLGGWFFNMNAGNQNRILKVAFPVAQKASSYEPTNIRLDFEYIFLENVFSPLVEIDAKGLVQPGVAEKADWIGNELRFTIRKGLKTASGVPITAADVVFSLKRLLVLSSNTHGNFKDLVCPGVQMKSVEETCPGIRQEGDLVFLTAKGRKSFLLSMLASIDFAIIPRSSVNAQTLVIENYRETSGPYYVAKDDEQGHIELRLNPHHYHAADNIAETIELIPSNSQTSEQSVQALLDKRVDHLTTVDSSRAETLLAFAEKHPEFSIHITMKIRSLVLVFTERGVKELTSRERRYIGQKLREAFLEIYKGAAGFEQRAEFFPSLGEGGLNEDQYQKIAVLNGDTRKPTKSFRLGLIKRGSLETWSVPINGRIKEADCYIEDNVPDFKKYGSPRDIPHAFIASTDTGFMEDINLISYSMNAGLLGLSKKEREEWLAKYMSTDEKEERIHQLKELHFKALAEPALVPLMASPYAALVRKPWRMELSELYANNQLWLIKTH